MAVIALKDYCLAPENGTQGLAPFDISLASGDVCAVQTDTPDLGHLFLRAVAMILDPLFGEYHFDGVQLSPRRYDEWLQYRRRISYVGPFSALISNLSIRENLLLSRYYYENDLSVPLSEDVEGLCHAAGLSAKLALRPADLTPLGRRIAIAIRELSREARLIVLDHTEDLLGHAAFKLLLGRIQTMQRQGVPVIMMSEGDSPIHRMTNRTIVIAGGRLREAVGPADGQMAPRH